MSIVMEDEIKILEEELNDALNCIEEVSEDYKLQFDGFSLFLFIMGFTSLTCLFGVVDGFIPVMLVCINILTWGLFGKAVKVE